ncbi:MAG: hypothetical protein Q8O63_09835, partial [Hoeflea sp.]|nr:hypothetical protein [Hoeflea sp.]
LCARWRPESLPLTIFRLETALEFRLPVTGLNGKLKIPVAVMPRFRSDVAQYRGGSHDGPDRLSGA